MLTKTIERIDQLLHKHVHKYSDVDLEVVHSRTLGVLVGLVLVIWFCTQSLGASLIAFCFLSIVVFHFLFFRVLSSFKRQINELKAQIDSLKETKNLTEAHEEPHPPVFN